ncbi:uncharacterized protein M437DRAFT_72951 [Aureobasidium melanogenum CBS 110374]|uniref:Zn(2)-C6 fungal-type domain-containing protein n=1 Tax=Aureobasidium melanogenum (strain CBS 110374) TaxID=1043003 RepID=A0A074WUV9_AURM1|nr:uncharacterized protein M437DRAFT_72951 [Aureobasidium melanogenum CBS 110374]KEQ66146.1 hypothetical protein M437DRAFT_72951 [Aureobasidium melanogenum CBS 110374]
MSSKPQGRQRVRKACVSCQQKKRKCNGFEPCDTCEGYGFDCYYNSATYHNGADTAIAIQDLETANTLQPNKNKRARQDFLEPRKSRYVGTGSAISFPLKLSRDMGAVGLPRLHSYAWNAGTRPEAIPSFTPQVVQLIRYEELHALTSVYFEVVHPVFGVIDKADFSLRCVEHWMGDSQSLGFDALVGMVCALGSLFAGDDRFAGEADLVKATKLLLDNISMIHGATEDFVVAWILRSLYLRATTRPHASWMSTCSTMHIIEAVGLHRELGTMFISSSSSHAATPYQKSPELRRRIFWTAKALNLMFSCEYGRSPIHLDDANCEKPAAADGHYTSELISLAKLMSIDRMTSRELLEDCPLLTLMRANASFCIYRRLCLYDPRPSSEHLAKVMKMGEDALLPAQTLALSNQVWWDVLTVPFHYICVLLHINSLESLSLLSTGMSSLRKITRHLGTHMAKEAELTANSLISVCSQRKEKEMHCLTSQLSSRSEGVLCQPDLEIQTDGLQTHTPLPEWLYDIVPGWDYLPNHDS